MASMNRTPPNQNISATTESVCKICNLVMTEKQPCVIITNCNHYFHRTCIENSLSTVSECPTCKLRCELENLKTYNFQNITLSVVDPNPRGRSRGAVPKNNNRNRSKHMAHDGQRSLHERSLLERDREPMFTPVQNDYRFPRISEDNRKSTNFNNRARNSFYGGKSLNSTRNSLGQNELPTNHENVEDQITFHNSSTASNSLGNAVDADQIGTLIETHLVRVLTNLNLLPTGNYINDHNNNTGRNLNTSSGSRDDIVQNNLGLRQNGNSAGNNSNENNLSGNNSGPRVVQAANSSSINRNRDSSSVPLVNRLHSVNTFNNNNLYSLNPDKITAIIQSWNIRFDGSSTGLSIDEFIYRIRSLTNDHLNGDFEFINRNLNILLTGKARDFYWRYHKHHERIDWEDFCEEIKCQYADCKSTFDIREEIRNRKQRSGETFDTFYDSICSIMDHLPSPLSDMELIEILTRNLRPEIRQDLLYIPVHSIPHLRKLVQKRETFLNDEHVRKNFDFRSSGRMLGRKVAEINFSEDLEDFSSSETPEPEVNAVQISGKTIRCWNCDEPDHFWDDCLQERKIFCYGCGAKATYKPQCPKCSNRKVTLSKNFRPPDQVRPEN